MTLHIAGQRFHRLVAIEAVRVPDRPGLAWRCQCDCGGETIASASALRAGHRRGCGSDCLLSPIGAAKAAAGSMVGLRSGLVVAQEVIAGAVGVKLRVKCDCGGERLASVSQLRRKQVKSCGCADKRKTPYDTDITGQRFGRLVALEKRGLDYRQGRRWLFQCDCGKQSEARVKDLRNGNTTSCGCRKRETFQGLMRGGRPMRNFRPSAG